MTKKELIEAVADFPDETEIFIYPPDGVCYRITNVILETGEEDLMDFVNLVAEE